MARINNLTNFLTDVATAIKSKLDDNTAIPAGQFDTKIMSIQTRGNYETRTVNATSNGSQTITPNQGYDAIESIVINTQVPIPQLQTKSYEFTDNTTITLSPETGYDGFSSVSLMINVPSGSINNQDKTITQNGVYTADSGYTGLGTVIVNVASGGSGDVKLFETVAEMQADTDKHEGDLAVIYREELQSITADSEFSSCICPNTVVLDTPVTGDINIHFYPINGEGSHFYGYIYNKGFSLEGNFKIRYTSTDGITYTRSDSGEELKDFGTLMKYESSATWNDVIGKFMKINQMVFDGFYEAVEDSNTITYQLATTQFNATNGDVYNKNFYGLNGSGSGTLATNISDSFIDTNGEIYSKIQAYYDTLTPTVITYDTLDNISEDITVMPCKSDGTPLFDTSNADSMTFSSCKKLVYVGALDMSSIQYANSMFKECSSLISIMTLKNTSGIRKTQQMFSGCTNLINAPLFDTSSVNDMNNMFFSCKSLIMVPLFNTGNVTNMEAMFTGCTSLITAPLFNTSNVTNMNMMFRACDNLVNVPLFDTSKVTDMSGIFRECLSLSNESLNNILLMCANSNVTSGKTLSQTGIGLSRAQATTCTTLSNYQAFLDAGWTTGYSE